MGSLEGLAPLVMPRRNAPLMRAEVMLRIFVTECKTPREDTGLSTEADLTFALHPG